MFVNGEYLNNIKDVWESLDKHHGIEYTDTVKDILENGNEYITKAEHEKTLKEKDAIYEDEERYADFLRNGIMDVFNELGELIEWEGQQKRLNRKELRDRLKSIYECINKNF